MIAIVNYGAGNIRSVQNMLSRVGARSLVTSNPSDLLSAEKILIPGVGSFDAGMSNLVKCGVVDALNECRHAGKPILGICLGAQLLGRRSEEGTMSGLGWIDMDIVKFKEAPEIKVPHMGWREVSVRFSHPLVKNIATDARFYFVHSYYMKPDDDSDELLTARYGIDFVAAVAHRNVMGVQFHPEKSHKFGMAILKNFLEMAI